MQFEKSFVILLIVIIPNISAGVKFEYNDHTMYEVFPDTIGQINALKELRDKNQHWIFWNAIGEKGSTVYIIVDNHMKNDFYELMKKTGIQSVKELYEVQIALKPKVENADNCKHQDSSSSLGPSESVPTILNSVNPHFKYGSITWNNRQEIFNFSDELTQNYISKTLNSIFDTLNVPSEVKVHQVALNLLDLAHLPEIVKHHELGPGLADLAFAQLFPGDRDFILERMRAFELCDTGYSNSLTPNLDAVKKIINGKYQNTNFTIYGRIKQPYSIWQKLQRKLNLFEKMCDQISISVIVNSVPECYEVQETIQNAYKIVPGTFKDLIKGTQKDSSGFQTLKSCLHGPYGKNLEIQVRTVAMEEVYGETHWAYKHRAHILGDL